MANDKRRSRRDLAADVAYVALAAASGMLFLIIKPGVNGPGLVANDGTLVTWRLVAGS